TLVTNILPIEGEREAARRYDSWTTIPNGWRRYWSNPYWDFIKPKNWSPSDFANAQVAQRKYIELTRMLHEAGITIVAGTDTPAPWVLPGAGLLIELVLLVEAGLTPAEAIQAATGNASAVLRKEQDVGTLQPGKIADFVVLDADPLADIRNL